jgi:hypothetical protein
MSNRALLALKVQNVGKLSENTRHAQHDNVSEILSSRFLLANLLPGNTARQQTQVHLCQESIPKSAVFGHWQRIATQKNAKKNRAQHTDFTTKFYFSLN